MSAKRTSVYTRFAAAVQLYAVHSGTTVAVACGYQDGEKSPDVET